MIYCPQEMPVTDKSASPFMRTAARPLLIAHRGGSLEAPENTLAALRHGIACGSDWQEVDITLTQDGHAVIIHDDTLERTTKGIGEVAAMTLLDLAALRAGAPVWTETARLALASLGILELPVFGDRYVEERIPTLHQVLALPGARLMLELKTTPRPEALAKAVIDAVHKAGMQDRVALGSFDLATVAAIKARDPSLARIGIADKEDMFAPLLDLGVHILAVDTPLVPKAVAAAPQGVAVWTWTVYTTAMAHTVIAQGADGLITDVPKQLVAALHPGQGGGKATGL